MTTGAGFAHDSSNPSQPPAGSAVVPGIHFGAAGVIASLRAARFLTRSASVRPACWNLVIPRCLRPHLGSRCHCVCVCGGGPLRWAEHKGESAAASCCWPVSGEVRGLKVTDTQATTLIVSRLEFEKVQIIQESLVLLPWVYIPMPLYFWKRIYIIKFNMPLIIRFTIILRATKKPKCCLWKTHHRVWSPVLKRGKERVKVSGNTSTSAGRPLPSGSG